MPSVNPNQPFKFEVHFQGDVKFNGNVNFPPDLVSKEIRVQVPHRRFEATIPFDVKQDTTLAGILKTVELTNDLSANSKPWYKGRCCAQCFPCTQEDVQEMVIYIRLFELAKNDKFGTFNVPIDEPRPNEEGTYQIVLYDHKLDNGNVNIQARFVKV